MALTFRELYERYQGIVESQATQGLFHDPQYQADSYILGLLEQTLGEAKRLAQTGAPDERAFYQEFLMLAGCDTLSI